MLILRITAITNLPNKISGIKQLLIIILRTFYLGLDVSKVLQQHVNGYLMQTTHTAELGEDPKAYFQRKLCIYSKRSF